MLPSNLQSLSPPAKRSILKKGSSPPSTSRSQVPYKHETNFQTVLPGYPEGYFIGILPQCPFGPVYPTSGFPGYDWTTLEPYTLNTPYKQSIWHPVSAEAMYVANMPWTAYPYGIPANIPTKANRPKACQFARAEALDTKNDMEEEYDEVQF